MILEKLTPAETLMIRYGPEAPLNDLLKYTMMDLLLKQAIKIQEVESQSNPRDPVRYNRYIVAGKNLNSYRHLAHESVYLESFHMNREMMFLFRNYVKMGYEKASSPKYYRKLLLTSPMMNAAFSANFFQKLAGRVSYSEEGVTMKNTLEAEIRKLEETLPALIQKDRNKALEEIRSIGGNIFLLKGIDFELMREIEEELLNELRRSQEEKGDTSGCYTGCWIVFDTYSADFNSSCSSDSNESSCFGGDSGDSGGDGGCGGGCGGD